MFIWTCKSVLSRHVAPADACVRRVSPLHAVLPRDGVAELRVVQEGHVDSDQRRPVSREDLTPDD